MDYKLYCDMDGVLTDFNDAYYKLTGIKIKGNKNSSPSFWEKIDKGGLKFWVEMPWKKDGKKLWNYIKEYKPTILSSPSKKNESRVGKIEWVERELGKEYKIILRSSSHKKDLADSKSILIDDREDNIEGWIEKGGIGILHTSTKKTIEELKKLGI